ncbi:MAG TPA: phosphoglycerate kinase [Chloroflexota bacterium]|nr:phosphoglycerate kinase [Chloroflexota bacterium]
MPHQRRRHDDRQGGRAVAKQSVRDVDVRGKRVLVRVDFNVPLDGTRITDDTRIRAAVPTIQYLIGQGAKTALISHLGRPDGKPSDKYRLEPVADRLTQLLGRPVLYLRECVGAEVERAIADMAEGGVALLENVRFHAEEEKNDPAFAEQLARLADVYVNDAFGTAHRAHASTEGVAHHLPAVAGFLMQKEIDTMERALANPERPFVAIIGGAKVSDKIGVLDNLLSKVNALLIGGGMANTFLVAIGCSIGQSLVEQDKVPEARRLISEADKRKVQLMLPRDVVIGSAFANDAERKTVTCQETPPEWRIMDIGPTTVKEYSDVITKAGTVVWNGPMGVFEMDNFADGTRGVATAVAACRGLTIVGGGDSVAAIEQAGLADQITHVSTGGGATLELLEGRTLPGVAALRDN